MDKIGERIKARLAQMGMTQAELARATGLGPARLGNYVQGTRPPDIASLVRIARVTGTTTDWLLGLSVSHPVEAKAVFLRLLLLDGMAEARAEMIAEAGASALRLLASFPDEGDQQTRANIAAQAAWQSRPPAKPH